MSDNSNETPPSSDFPLIQKCGKPCSHGSPCILGKDHARPDRHATSHGCIFYDPKPTPETPNE